MITRLDVRMTPRRMVNAREAAEYTGLTAGIFKAACPVAPIEMAHGRQLYDLRDLDRWIDTLKAGASDDDDALLSRLG